MKIFSNNRIQDLALSLAGLLLIYIAVGYSVPVSWYVDIEKYRALDACIGDDSIIYYTERTPRWGIKGESYSQIVKFEDDLALETTIHRGSVREPVSFGYEPNTFDVQYATTWFYVGENVYKWPDAGTYGANEWITIYPLPLIQRSWFNPAHQTQFNVTPCDS